MIQLDLECQYYCHVDKHSEHQASNLYKYVIEYQTKYCQLTLLEL